jgi:Xaa-Pro dipeptidase
MALHFSREELASRRERACAAVAQAGLDGLLIFRQESMYYLTGYDTFGYVFFQCLYLGADGGMTLLTRAPDRLQAKVTSVIEDVRIWVDAPDARPADMLRDILVAHGCKGKKLGVEWEAYGLTARNGQRLSAALDGVCTLVDASDLVSRLRGGGDDPANEYIIGSGPNALLCRYATGRRRLDADDMLTLEFAGVYRHYHACLMRTLCVGKVDPRLEDMHKACVDALHAAEDALRPGRPIGEVFDAHARVLDAAGHRAHRLNACGYSLGTTFAPNWMDWPMFYRGNPYVAEPGNVFFIHIIVFDDANGLAMTLGRTSEVTASGATPLSTASLEFKVGT